MFDQESSLLNIKKFFQYITSFLYAADENGENSLKKATNDIIHHIQNLTNSGLQDKTKENQNDELQKFEESDSMKSADKTQYQNSLTFDAPNESTGSRKAQTLSNDGPLNNKQDTQKSESQNPRDNQDNGEMQIYPSGNVLNKKSNDEITQNSSKDKQLMEKPSQKTQNSNNKDSTSENMEAETQNLIDSDIECNAEMQNSPTDIASNKGSFNSGRNMLKSDNDFLKNNKPTANTKTETQNSNNKDSTDKSENDTKNESSNLANSDTQGDDEMQISSANNASDESLDKESAKNIANDDSSNKQPKLEAQNSSTDDDFYNTQSQKSQNNMNNETPNAGNIYIKNIKIQESTSDDISNKAMKSSNDDSSKNNRLTENSKEDIQNSNNKNSKNFSENNMKTQNSEQFDIPNKSSTGREAQDISANGSLNKQPSRVNTQNSSSNNSSKSLQPSDNSEDHQQNPIYENNLNRAAQDKKMQNPSNNENQMESISALKSEKSNGDLTDYFEMLLQDYDDYITDELMLDDSFEKSVEEYKDYEGEEEEENEDDKHQNDVDETETESVYINDNTDDNENDVKKNDAEKEDKNEPGHNNVNGNNYKNNENKTNIENKNSRPVVNIQEKSADKPITLPKLIMQTLPHLKNHSIIHPNRNQINNNDNIKSVNSHEGTNEENLLQEFQQNNDEFVDDYINNWRGENPKSRNDQIRNIQAPNSNGNSALNKKNSLGSSVILNNDEKDHIPLNAVPFVDETLQGQNVPFHQSQNTKDNIWLQSNTNTYANFDERKGTNFNQGPFVETFPANVPYVVAPFDRPILATPQSKRNEEITQQKMFPFQQTLYLNNLQNKVAAPQENYNIFTQPATFGFQDTIPSDNQFYSDVPAMNEYRPEITSSFQNFPNKPLLNEDYLNNQYNNYNFQNEKTPDSYNVNNQQFEETQPIMFQPNVFSNIEYFSNQDAPVEQDKAVYFQNYEPGRSYNTPVVKNPIQDTGMLSNDKIAGVLQTELPFNQDSSPTGFENNIYETTSQVQPESRNPQNSNKQTLNPQNQFHNQHTQDNLLGKQMLFPQHDKLSQQNPMNNSILSDKNVMNTNSPLIQDKIDNTKILPSQDNIYRSKEVPQRTFNIGNDNFQITPKNQDSPQIINKRTTPKPQLQQTEEKSNKHLMDKRQKNLTFDQPKSQEAVSRSESFSRKNKIENNYISENNYGNADYTNEDEEQEEDDVKNEDEEQDDDDVKNEDEEQEEDDDENGDDNENEVGDENEDGGEIEDDFLNEKNYDNETNESMDENEDDDKDEFEDDFVNENSTDNEDKEDSNENEYEDEEENENKENDENKDDHMNEYHHSNKNKTSRRYQNPQNTVTINEKKHGNTTPKFGNQVNSNKKSHSLLQPPASQIKNDNTMPEPSESLIFKNKDNPSSNSQLSNNVYNKEYNDDHSGSTPVKENKPTDLSDGTVNNAYKQIFENPSSDNKIETPEKSDSESASSKQGGNYNTILEYVYKFSNNPLFKGVKEENR